MHQALDLLYLLITPQTWGVIMASNEETETQEVCSRSHSWLRQNQDLKLSLCSSEPELLLLGREDAPTLTPTPSWCLQLQPTSDLYSTTFGEGLPVCKIGAQASLLAAVARAQELMDS